jgi:hypothetical protein
VVAVALVSFAGGVWLLTSFNARSEGPLASLLERMASAVGSLEHKIRGGAGRRERSRSLAWLEPYRRDPCAAAPPGGDVCSVPTIAAFPRRSRGIERLEQHLGTTLPLIQIYTAWGDRPEQQFPLVLAKAISNMGSIPVITWEPWLTDFESGRHPHIALRPARESHGMAAVARGDYDFYVDAWAAAAARYHDPLLLRFGHEMNDAYRYPWGPQNNTKEEYIAAWRHVVGRFRQGHADNVLWVWSPHVAYEYWEQYYPGEAYVDWVATGALNFGPIAQWSKWWSFDEIFGQKYSSLAGFGKPIMLAEFGSLAVGGDRTAWYTAALTQLRTKYPAVRALLFFNVSGDQTVTYQKVDWTFLGDSGLTRAVAKAMQTKAPK